MLTITTTQLRTKSKELVKVLNEGKKIDLIHRSKIVGQITPMKVEVKTFKSDVFLAKIKGLKLPHLTDKEVEKAYTSAMEEKHGKNISRHK